MVHYTCDMCGRQLLEDEDIRYVVKIEVYTACDAMEEADDDDVDEDVHGSSEENESGNCDERHPEMFDDEDYKAFRFDLCTKCHEKYLQDPLFLKSWNRLHFSEN